MNLGLRIFIDNKHVIGHIDVCVHGRCRDAHQSALSSPQGLLQAWIMSLPQEMHVHWTDYSLSQIRNIRGWSICLPSTQSNTHSLWHRTIRDGHNVFSSTRVALPHIHTSSISEFLQKLHYRWRFSRRRTQSCIEHQYAKRQRTPSGNDLPKHQYLQTSTQACRNEPMWTLLTLRSER